jgi:hypothetical protein
MMSGLDRLDLLYVGWSFFFHIALIALFAVRKVNLDAILKYGWVFYALSIPAVVVSVLILRGGKPFSFWIAGFVFLVWAIFGYVVEYQMGINWRGELVWPVLVPFVLLYLTTVMFYWWPVGQFSQMLWYLYAAFFAIETYLNVSSH